MADQMNQWLTAEELSAHLRVPLSTLYYWRQVGRGPRATKFGRRLTYARADVQAYEDQCRKAADLGGGAAA